MQHFQMYFHDRKWLYSNWKFNEIDSWVFNYQQIVNDLGNKPLHEPMETKLCLTP